ncbi:hypothetical protein L7F22_005388 [Adiantum nelumboides]|nr:hypothetical protein [Adiantum nelumboides]
MPSMSTAPAILSSQQDPSLPSSPPPNQTLAAVEDFKCNICLNIASDAVVTVCGHLFCWPCLYTWLHYHSRYKECPVCKGATSEARVIPIYSWGFKDAENLSKLHGNSNKNIPPRPPARRVESERQRRQRYQAERGRQMNQPASDMHYPTLNQVMFGLDDFGASSGGGLQDERVPTNNTTTSTNANSDPNSNAANMNHYLMGRETRASWLERLRAMREERLVWPVAFIHGLTSRELLQQRRQAREHTLSPRMSINLAQESPLVDINADVAAWYCQSGRAQTGALQRALSLAGLDHDLRHLMHNQSMPVAASPGGPNTSHTVQYLSTMSSILSSMEVFAKALELSSASSLSQSASSASTMSPTATMPHQMQAFNTPNEEHALWQASMRRLLAQMERLTMQLQSIQPMNNSTNHHTRR